jgi:hypothetical protein
MAATANQQWSSSDDSTEEFVRPLWSGDIMGQAKTRWAKKRRGAKDCGELCKLPELLQGAKTYQLGL